MNKHISQLVRLQTIDLEIDRIENTIKAEQQTLDQRIGALAEKEALITELTTMIAGKDKEKRVLEDDMADKIDHVKDRQSKMMRVQTGREQTALLKEIEDAKKSVKENEERIVAIMLDSEKLIAQCEEEKNLLKGEKGLVVEEKEKVRVAIETISKEKKAKDAVRQQEAALVENRLLKKYDMLRLRRNGVAVVNILQGVCQGCFMNIPPQKFNLLLRGDDFLECPTCQRIIYHQPLDEIS